MIGKQLTFRAKLLLIVATSALAFAVLVGTSVFLTNRMAHHLSEIRDHYLPIIELGPRLEADFERIRRSFHDSVAAQDFEALKKTRDFKAAFMTELASNGGVIGLEQASALRDGLEEYYASFYNVSQRMILKETGPQLVDDMKVMQDKQKLMVALLAKAFRFDHEQLSTIFSSIATVLATNGRFQMLISVVSLVLLILISIILSRDVFHSLALLSRGLRRFGQGQFDQPIEVFQHDELGEVANEANRMAARINSLMKELDSFSYSVAHDLRAPLRGVSGFANILLEDHGASLNSDAKNTVQRIIGSSQKMGQLIDGLLDLSRLIRKEIVKKSVDVSSLAQNIANELRSAQPERKASFEIAKNLVAQGDEPLLKAALTNLLQNAWKYSAKQPEVKIVFGVQEKDGIRAFFVRDNGAGFDMRYADKLFGAFQRLHSEKEFAGTGIGLATTQRIIHRHGGTIWAESAPNQGATFYFTV